MLVACFPVLVTLLVGLPSTFTAQTLNHQQQDISGALGTNPASPGDFGGKHLLKHPTHSVKATPKAGELSTSNHISMEYVRKNGLELHNLTPVMPGRAQKPSNQQIISQNGQERSFPCPTEADIVPCVCTITATNDLVLNCSKIISVDQLAGVFLQDFPFTSFYELRIYDNDNFQYLIGRYLQRSDI